MKSEKEHKFKYPNGIKVRDIITGFEGVIMSRTNYLTGCDRYAIQSTELNKDGKPQDWLWFDETMLEVIEEKKIEKQKSRILGGPKPDDPKGKY